LLPGDGDNDDDAKPKDPDKPKENPCADEERAAREAEQTVEGIQTDVKELEDHIARLREEIRELESEAARFEALAEEEEDKYGGSGDNPSKTFPAPPGKLNKLPAISYLYALKILLDPKPLNRGENRDLAEDRRKAAEKRRTEISMIEHALDETRRRLLKAGRKARKAAEALQNCRNQRE